MNEDIKKSSLADQILLGKQNIDKLIAELDVSKKIGFPPQTPTTRGKTVNEAKIINMKHETKLIDYNIKIIEEQLIKISEKKPEIIANFKKRIIDIIEKEEKILNEKKKEIQVSILNIKSDIEIETEKNKTNDYKINNFKQMIYKKIEEKFNKINEKVIEVLDILKFCNSEVKNVNKRIVYIINYFSNNKENNKSDDFDCIFSLIKIENDVEFEKKAEEYNLNILNLTSFYNNIYNKINNNQVSVINDILKLIEKIKNETIIFNINEILAKIRDINIDIQNYNKTKKKQLGRVGVIKYNDSPIVNKIIKSKKVESKYQDDSLNQSVNDSPIVVNTIIRFKKEGNNYEDYDSEIDDSSIDNFNESIDESSIDKKKILLKIEEFKKYLLQTKYIWYLDPNLYITHAKNISDINIFFLYNREKINNLLISEKDKLFNRQFYDIKEIENGDDLINEINVLYDYKIKIKDEVKLESNNIASLEAEIKNIDTTINDLKKLQSNIQQFNLFEISSELMNKISQTLKDNIAIVISIIEHINVMEISKKKELEEKKNNLELVINRIKKMDINYDTRPNKDIKSRTSIKAKLPVSTKKNTYNIRKQEIEENRKDIEELRKKMNSGGKRTRRNKKQRKTIKKKRNIRTHKSRYPKKNRFTRKNKKIITIRSRTKK